MHKNILVFDIETIPDLESAGRLLNLNGASDEEIHKQLINYHLNITDGKNSFIRQPLHKVIAISFLEAEVVNNDGEIFFQVRTLRSGGSIESTEKELVSGFFQLMNSRKPTLVTYNGRTFDLPVLKYRALKNMIDCGHFYKCGDKWSNYQSRYSLDWHCDLLEALSDFGASARVKLDEICALLNLPGKICMKGEDVYETYMQGGLKKIREYCEVDVANTYMVYLFYCLHTGLINREGFELSKESFLSCLAESTNPELQNFLSFIE